MIQIKRIYEKPEKRDGARILVDRLWPRGISKKTSGIDLWLKDAAPSPELRVWFSHDPDRFAEFKKRYTNELKRKTNALKTIKQLEKKQRLATLLYAAKDLKCNHAIVLRDYLKKAAFR